MQKYTIKQHIKLLEYRISMEKVFLEEITGDTSDENYEEDYAIIERKSYIDGMEYALDILKNPSNNGMEEALN